MDERIWMIAEILDQSGPMTADELAAQLKLSGKTVRSLIKTYAKEMQENGFCITAKPGRGSALRSRMHRRMCRAANHSRENRPASRRTRRSGYSG